MSDIPQARLILEQVLEDDEIDLRARRRIHRALALLHREKCVRRAPPRYIRITERARETVRRLAHTKMTCNEIAAAAGLRNGGRVSEILHGKR